MKKQQLNEVFRLQQLAGLKPVNEYFFFDKDGEETQDGAPEQEPTATPTDYCYGTFDGLGFMVDGDDKQVKINPEDLEAKGYKKLEFNTFEEFISSEFAKKNQGQIKWDFMHPEQGKRFFDTYSSKYGPFIVYTQDSILEKNEE